MDAMNQKLKEQPNCRVNKKNTIKLVYVFGPKGSHSDYMKSEPVKWIKIGETECVESADKWEAALKRINGISRTGVPEVCTLYDVFKFPNNHKNQDDRVRWYLTDDVYGFKSSASANKQIMSSRDIKAGTEFIYDATRKHVLNAIAKYERDLVIECDNDDEKLKRLVQLIRDNYETIDDDNLKGSKTIMYSSIIPDASVFWKEVVDKINQKGLKISICDTSRNYVHIKSKHGSLKKYLYAMSFSEKSQTAMVSFESLNGDEGRKLLRGLAEQCEATSKIKGMEERIGVRNKNKCCWIANDSLTKTKEELVDWFVSMFCAFYEIFESDLSVPLEDNESEDCKIMDFNVSINSNS